MKVPSRFLRKGAREAVAKKLQRLLLPSDFDAQNTSG